MLCFKIIHSMGEIVKKVYLMLLPLIITACTNNSNENQLNRKANKVEETIPALSEKDKARCAEADELKAQSASSLMSCVKTSTDKFKKKTKNTDDIVTAVNYSCDLQITNFAIATNNSMNCEIARDRNQSLAYTIRQMSPHAFPIQKDKEYVKKGIYSAIVTRSLSD